MPELRSGRLAQPAPRLDPPRYDALRIRRNPSGSPSPLDRYRSVRPYAPRPELAPIGPTVRTDAATRINQLAPRR